MLALYISLLDTDEEKQKMSEIYEKYRYYCIYIAKKLVENSADAEDATHMAFLEIIKDKKKYFAMECSDFRAVLVVIVKNKAIDILRERKRQRAKDDEPLGDNIKDEAPSVVELLSSQEDYDMLRKALKELSPSYNQVLTLKYFEDLCNAGIAEALNTNKKNVEVLLYRAKVSLRKAMDKMKGEANELTKL